MYTCERCKKFSLGEINKRYLEDGYVICLPCTGYFIIGTQAFLNQLRELLTLNTF